MRATVLFLFIFSQILLNAKDTKKITKVNIFPNFDEVYYVLKSDNSIKHGVYKAEINGKVLIEGHYNMGEMDSLWTHYDLSGVIRSRGWFKSNKRDSIWEFFDKKGELEQKIDFSTAEVLLFRTGLAQNPFRIISGCDTIMSILDRPPLFLGGMSRFKDYLAEELHIPLHKPNEKITGTVFVSFIIDSVGNTSNYRVLKGIGRVCNNEALRVLKSISEPWIPGELNGKNVSVEYILPIIFDSTIRGMTPSDFETNILSQLNEIPISQFSNHQNLPVGGWVFVSPIFDSNWP
ncbi:MAG: energy transducer TonB [Prolixibacteraceae bacterium]